MDVLVTGGGGLLAREVTRVLSLGGTEVRALPRGELDVTDGDAVFAAIAALGPRSIVHCAAFTNVDGCEAEPDRARAVNALGSANVAAAAADVGAEVVAISTDYVFNGRKGAYTEEDQPDPVQHYGRTKLEGEQLVRSANPRHYIVRPAWIHGVGGKNFLSRLPASVAAGTPLKAVRDQTGSPTYARDLAEAIRQLLGSEAYGTYHVTNAGACTFAQFCRRALERMGADVGVEEVSWRDLGLPAQRPEDTSLENLAWRRAGFDLLRPWEEALDAFVEAVG